MDPDDGMSCFNSDYGSCCHQPSYAASTLVLFDPHCSQSLSFQSKSRSGTTFFLAAVSEKILSRSSKRHGV